MASLSPYLCLRPWPGPPGDQLLRFLECQSDQGPGGSRLRCRRRVEVVLFDYSASAIAAQFTAHGVSFIEVRLVRH